MVGMLTMLIVIGVVAQVILWGWRPFNWIMGYQ